MGKIILLLLIPLLCLTAGNARQFSAGDAAKAIHASGKLSKGCYRMYDDLTPVKNARVGYSLGAALFFAEKADGETGSNPATPEAGKKQREIVIYSMLLLFLLAAAGFLYKIKSDKKKSAKAIENLCKAAMAQIARLRAEKQMAVADERERLGKDLHDGLSGTLAGCYQRLTLLMMESRDEHTREEIKNISNTIAAIHTAIRNKSHELSGFKENFLDKEHKEKIKAIMDSAFPDRYYTKELVIEEGVVPLIRKSYRENILYILQECFTNIVKHAKATEVSVILSRSSRCLLLQVTDNGVGIKSKHSSVPGKTLGLDSIRKRTADIHGTLAIYADEGTTISIRFPSIATPLTAFS